jgi:hypothetical protein
VGLPASVLPATILEFLADCDPVLVRSARADAARLLDLGYQAGFAKLEDLPTTFFEMANVQVTALIEEHARRTGLIIDEARTAVSGVGADLERHFSNLARHYHLVLNFEMAGGKIFRVAPALAERLLATRIDVPAGALRLPFRSLMLVFDDDSSIRAFHAGQPFGRTPRGGTISSVIFDLQVDGEACLLATSIHTQGRKAHGMIERSMRYGQGSLDAMLDTHWPGTGDASQRSPAKDFHRLFLNTLLYISSDGARTTSPRRAPAPRDPLNRSSREFVLAGDGLVPWRAGPGLPGGSRVAKSGRGSRARQLVAGHWKYQAHGTKLSERKLLWIEPYWRGPDFAELVNRPRLIR